VASGVDAPYLLSSYLGGLVTRLPKLADKATLPFLTDAITDAEWSVSRELGTRFDVTHFVPEITSDAVAPLDQTAGPTEYEPFYQWPGVLPGDGFPRIKTRVRPISKIVSATLYVPGTIITCFKFDASWLRVDRKSNEIVIAPTGTNAVYALAYAMGGLGWRTPQSLALEYYAGLDSTIPSPEIPSVKRLVALQATINLLPLISSWMNPTAIEDHEGPLIGVDRIGELAFGRDPRHA